MADTTVTSVSSPYYFRMWGPYYSDADTAVVLYGRDNANGPAKYNRTTDGGATWSSEELIFGNVNNMGLACWFDKDTPGDSGTLVHILAIDMNVWDLVYRTLDVATGTLGTRYTVESSISS